jgi:urea carboxylase
LKVEESTFNLAEYQKFLDSISVEAAAFKQHQKEAFDGERERWRAAGLLTAADPPETLPQTETAAVPEGCEGVSSPLTASVFQIVVKKGQAVAEGERLIVLDAMKIEIGIVSHIAGTVEDIHCEVGALVNAGQLLLAIQPS